MQSCQCGDMMGLGYFWTDYDFRKIVCAVQIILHEVDLVFCM